MKKISLFASCALLIVVLSVSSCTKKKDSQQAPSNTAPQYTIPGDANGAFAAVKTISSQTIAGYTTSIDIGTAVAWFGSSTSFVDGGTVKLNSNSLSKQSNNAYVFTPATTAPTGIDFTGSEVWEISGNTANGVPAFTKTHYASFPYITDISNTGDVSTTTDFTLSASSYVTGDSVIFVVSGPNGHVLKVKGPNSTSCSFTAAEMGTLGTGSNMGLLQIAPYTWTVDNSTGKKYYFVKETCVSKFVNLK
jgi:hypothetical protein